MVLLVLIIVAVLALLFVIFALRTGLFEYWKKNHEENKKRSALKRKSLHVTGNVKSINAQLFHDNIIIGKGATLGILSNHPGLTAEVDENGVLNLRSEVTEEQPDNILTEICIPREVDFDFIKINLQKGDLTIDDAEIKNLELTTGDGDILLTNVNTSNSTVLKISGRGNIVIKEGSYHNVDVDVNDGTVNNTSKLFGNNKFNVKMGSMTIRVLRPLKFFKIHIEAESGFVGYEGRRGTKFKTDDKPESIECLIGIGNASLTYHEDSSVLNY